MMMHTLKTVALVLPMIAPSPVIAHQPQMQHQPTTARRLTTDQMYRDYMESGSIYYGDRRVGALAHIVKQVAPTIQGIEHEARQFAFASDPYIPNHR
jgi:hypothetical protein